MSNSIVAKTEVVFDNPFDSILRIDPDGCEFWYARELMPMLGYKTWQKFNGVVETAVENLETVTGRVIDHVIPTDKMVVRPQGGGSKQLDYKLSRLACYHIALCCDSRGNDSVKLAKHYFAVKTRQAEVVVPAQSEQLKELELRLAIAQAQQATVEGQAFLLSRSEAIVTMHGVQVLALIQNRPDAVVEVTKKVTETIICKDGRTVSFEGQSLAELAKELGFKTGKQLEAWLRRNNADHFISQGFRALMAPYIPTEDIGKVKELWSRCKNRQLLIGE